MQHARRFSGITFVMVLAIAALGGGTAQAQSSETAWEFGGYVLYSLIANGTEIDDTFGYGVRGGYLFGTKHQVDLSYDQGTADSMVPGVTEVDLTKICVSYMRRFQMRNKEKIVPVATFGLGTIATDNGADDEWSSFYKAGGGMKYFMTKRLALRFDGSLYRWDGDGRVVPKDGFFSFDFVLGLSVLVGGGA